jgi:hypothetical protein
MVGDTQLYPVGGASSVRLEVVYGYAQPGSTVTTWQGEVESVPPEGRSYDRGGGPLGGSMLFCKSSVKDENPATNRTSVVYRLSGGPEAKEYPYEVVVPENGGLAEYSINFVFV